MIRRTTRLNNSTRKLTPRERSEKKNFLYSIARRHFVCNESAVSDVLKDIEINLHSFIDKAQTRFEAICKSEYHHKRVRAYIDAEDGFVSDDGCSSIYAVLYDPQGDIMAEVTYSFKEDGIFDDNDDFVGETYSDLIEDLASRFASEYDV